jgi:hypothetical protein
VIAAALGGRVGAQSIAEPQLTATPRERANGRHDMIKFRRMLDATTGREAAMRVSWDDIWQAFELAMLASPGEHQAFLCKQSGKVYWHSEFTDDPDELPDDIEDEEKYLPLPDKRELNLGKPLAFAFVSEFLPEAMDEVGRIFRKKGAYGRFKHLLASKNALQQWYEFEAAAEERALRAWCELHSIEIADRSD